METKFEYQVIVNNLGTVFLGDNELLARQTFNDYKKLSIHKQGRVSGESVTLLGGDEILKEYQGKYDD